MKKNDFLIDEFIFFVKEIYSESNIPLHRPVFNGNEKNYLSECIDTNFVSSVGKRVNGFEKNIADYTGSNFAIATVNGTSALHISMILSGVEPGDEVLTQSLTFIATCNAISYSGASPIFIDVDIDTLGMSPKSLKSFLAKYAIKKGKHTFNKLSGKRIGACVPMHTFGFPLRIEEICDICEDWNIPLIEDAAESLGSFSNKKHTGTFGQMGTLSFNGNKVITTGGGGMIITDDKDIAKKAKHITTTAKVPHSFKFIHDEIAYNYRMPNINAALGCAQIERIQEMLSKKRILHNQYRDFFSETSTHLMEKIPDTEPNYWLNTIVLDSKKNRDEFLNLTNAKGVMTRPIWELMSELEMFKHCQNDGLTNSYKMYELVVNIPSSVPFLKDIKNKK